MSQPENNSQSQSLEFTFPTASQLRANASETIPQNSESLFHPDELSLQMFGLEQRFVTHALSEYERIEQYEQQIAQLVVERSDRMEIARQLRQDNPSIIPSSETVEHLAEMDQLERELTRKLRLLANDMVKKYVPEVPENTPIDIDELVEEAKNGMLMGIKVSLQNITDLARDTLVRKLAYESRQQQHMQQFKRWGVEVPSQQPEPIETPQKVKQETAVTADEQLLLDTLQQYPEGLTGAQLKQLMGISIYPSKLALRLREKDPEKYGDLVATEPNSKGVWILPESLREQAIVPVPENAPQPTRQIEIFESNQNILKLQPMEKLIFNFRLLGKRVNRRVLLSNVYGTDINKRPDYKTTDRFEKLVESAKQNKTAISKQGFGDTAEYELHEDTPYTFKDQLVDLLRLNPNNAFSETELLEMFYPDNPTSQQAKTELASLISKTREKAKEGAGIGATIERIEIGTEQSPESGYYLDITNNQGAERKKKVS